MQFLLTIHKDTDLDTVCNELGLVSVSETDSIPRGVNVVFIIGEPIPVGGDIVVVVNGPDNLPILVKNHPKVREIHPGSEMDYFNESPA